MNTEQTNGWFCARHQRKISGVCAGFADYYQQPRWLIRLLAVLLLITAPLLTISAYFIGAVLLPQR
ncbi:PspC domain-containing protein [Rheinheimera salexigens]|uniref:Stress-responsive transcriptional regulator n=1 Tax=Rheinheimera salexigens TaxID=1628148 RepID=A0A1E7Q4A9_9GAMM|nr:PspC domain-containing protein [Rheinheimera salexigens]OEY69032.1 stress-responsive transcriptional regulator [Rheinheimera salexigens]